MSSHKKEDSKTQALCENGTLHPHPETVHDERFQENDFFDARDSLQVKYEMLRRVAVEGKSIKKTAEEFGFSRPSFYHARSAFEAEGLAGLLPQRRGPQRAHKLKERVMEFIEQSLQADESLRASGLAERVERRFGLCVHPRSIERALERRRKKKR